ncbi:MAG TPA: hypothetical protein VK636_12545 [Gemmatimonadaceae bacterium]|nr:hypothetical protein [Gemmatimonadaceae bacterium]
MLIVKCVDGPYAGRTVMFKGGADPVDVHGLGAENRVERYTLTRDGAGQFALRHIAGAGADTGNSAIEYGTGMD